MKNIMYAVSGSMILPFFAMAASDFSSVRGVFAFACSIFGLLFWIFIMAAVVFILWSAFDYLTAGGDGKKVNEAAKKLMYAVVGIIVALVARYVPNLAADLAGVSISAENPYGIQQCGD